MTRMARTTSIYEVTGMTCEHWVGAIAEEVSALPGLEAVDLDLATAPSRVVGKLSLPADVGAVREAGYAVAS